MRVLLDECVNAGVRAALPGHAVRTVPQAGWSGIKDIDLLKLAHKQFDVFVTIDRKLETQCDLESFNLRFVIVRVPDNRIDSYRPLFDEIRQAVESSVQISRVR